MVYNHYSPMTDNARVNSVYQGIDYSQDIDEQIATRYPGIDNLQNVTLRDDYIYITTHYEQHKRIANGQALDAESHTALSGYFTNESTIKPRIDETSGTFDAYGIARDTCIEPFSKTGNPADACDKAHLDRFYVDRDRLEEIYGTRDFNAAIGKCNANNQFGADGGDQGYNHALNELYNNGCLKYDGTYTATPESVTKCRDDYKNMSDYREQKCQAQLSGKSPEEVQNIGYTLDSRCHDKTNFNVKKSYNSQIDLENAYKDKNTKYNSDKASSTQPSDRITKNAQGSSNVRGNTNNSPEKADKTAKKRGNNVNQEQARGKTESNGRFGNNNNESVNLDNAERQVRGNTDNTSVEENIHNEEAEQLSSMQEDAASDKTEGVKQGSDPVQESSTLSDADDAKRKAQKQNQAKAQNANQEKGVDKLSQNEMKKAAEESAKKASEKSVQEALPKAQGVGM